MTSQPQFLGPFYCETGYPWLGMAEPVNTITNAAIIVAAYFAYRAVKKSRVGFSADLVLLIFLLAMVGIGSTLWHGLRTRWALQLDWIPGVLFLLVLTALWFRQLFGWFAGIGGAILMYAATVASAAFAWRTFGDLHGAATNLRFVPGFAVITLFGLALVAATRRKFGREAAVQGVIILSCGIGAAVARSIDLLVCPYVPIGTHFLWHLLLSTASFLGILLLVRMKKQRRAVLALSEMG
ncbi:MAG TPA: ceramidase domain-containing protein [Rhizomicrobium sp.]